MLLVLTALQAVLNYTNDFNDQIKKGQPTLVKFYAPWCGHCKALKPKYEELSELVKNTPFKIAEVDCTTQPAICQQNDIKGYPTLLYFNNGVMLDEYRGKRDVNKMKQWLLNKLE